MNKELVIISGAQTGVDQGALDFAIKHGFKWNGFVTNDLKDENGTIPQKYHVNLHKLRSHSYTTRTRANVIAANATFIFSLFPLGRGSMFTKKACLEFGKPYLLCMSGISDEDIAAKLKGFIEEVKPKILNVAGSRESRSFGIGARTTRILELALL